MRCPTSSGDFVSESAGGADEQRPWPSSSAGASSSLCLSRSTGDMPRGVVDDPIRYELLDVCDAQIARAFEIIEGELCGAVGLVELLGTLADVPFRLEFREIRSSLEKSTR